MQVSNLVENNRIVDDACFVDFVKLFDCVVLFQIKAEDTVNAFSKRCDTSNQKYFLCGDFHALKASQWRGYLQFHKFHVFKLDMESLNNVKCSFIFVVASKNKYCVIIK